MSLFRISSIARYDENFAPQKTFKPDDDTVLLFDFTGSDKLRLLDVSKNKRHGTVYGSHWVTLD